jgi:formate dehydrogenase major subunit
VSPARPTDWPLLKQLRGSDRLGKGAAVRSRGTERTVARTETADDVVPSICPYCAVGCAQKVYVKDGHAIQIEGDVDSPVSRGRLCPKGSASLQLTTGDAREHQVLYRRPHATDWEALDLDTAMDMVAERLLKTRLEGWEWEKDGKRVRRAMGVASLGGATLDNEENYLIKKLFTALGVVQVENQARVCHSSTVVGLGTSFGRGGATTFPGDLPNADLILLEGSNMAEAHPVAFQWVVEAKARGATVVHVDPHYSRTSALADEFVPLRAGTDIVFLGGLINHVLSTGSDFREYVLAYTNASTILREDFRDTEDLDGVFSGFDPESGTYEYSTWQYEGADVAAASGDRDQPEKEGDGSGREPAGASIRHAGAGESAGSGGASVSGEPQRDPTLQHPRCVFNVLKRHYARYTPDVVERECGIPQEQFARICDLVVANSGRERTMAFVYGVGWTQHTIGSQYIRAASVLQLLLGNIGRKGGGIMAMRGHASIQGSSDIPTLFDLLPGYIPMPHAHEHETLEAFIKADAAQRGYWGNMHSYVVSLLKAWWGDAATDENDFCFDYLPRLTGSHGHYDTVMGQLEGSVKGYFLMGQNPAVGSANNRMQRMGMANLDWLVVRDFSLIESATWWKDGPEIESGELRTQDIGTEVFFFPAAAHIEKDGSFTNTQRLLQWHRTAQEPEGDARSDLWFIYHLGRRLREKLAGSTEAVDRPLLDLTWDYPTEGEREEPSADAVLAEINGYDADGRSLSAYTELKPDGSTSCGCWIYCGVYADGVNQAARRTPKEQQNWTGSEWGWAWPANRRVLYNRASADPDGRPWSERKAMIWWDPGKGDAGEWTGHDVPDFEPTKPPTYRPPKDARGPDAIAGDEPFIMQADGRGWLYAPAGLADGPMPAHYEPQDSPFANGLYRGQLHNPARQRFRHPLNPYHPEAGEPGVGVFPFVVTTYRLTEHFTAGGMSRWLPYLAELQPEPFFEVSPALARLRGLEHAGWATMVTARGAIEARVMVTDRMVPLTVQDQTAHQIGVPYHWGPNGLSTGDSFNELLAIVLDPSAHIQEDKTLSADIVPGRRPRGTGRTELVREYRRRAGITQETGMKP